MLEGFGRFAIRGEPFPGIVPSPGDAVEGLVYLGIDGFTRARIEAWEGPHRRDAVTVRRRTDDAAIAAETFVMPPRWRHILMRAAWDVEVFEREWHDACLRELVCSPAAICRWWNSNAARGCAQRPWRTRRHC